MMTVRELMSGMHIHFFGSQKPAAQQAVQQLIARYGQSDLANADYVVSIGGDGTTLSALSTVLSFRHVPVFSMRLAGSVGALGNLFELEDLPQRLRKARRLTTHPLKTQVTLLDGTIRTCFGINEIVVSRQLLQAARLNVTLGSSPRSHHIVGDGLLVATPIGSNAYNQSAGGLSLPRDSRLLALTGIAVRRPSDWYNRAVGDHEIINVEVIDPRYRPVRVETTTTEIRNIKGAKISFESEAPLTVLVERELCV
jgi:NAD+ kinase